MNTSNSVNLLKAGLSLLLVIKPLDQFGNPTVVDGIPAWTSSDESIITLSVSGDGLSARATSVGPVGTASVSVIADADLSSGVRDLTGVEEITVVAGEAVSLGEEVDQEAVASLYLLPRLLILQPLLLILQLALLLILQPLLLILQPLLLILQPLLLILQPLLLILQLALLLLNS